ncbi:Hypothetical protein CINCED_3A006410 [Cinara cedri]|uniref:Uncharacterized protein n=1 Tax=Cinara cedri TaxID=506608 RepID=A0A5E4MTK8_9HEMI|nr:Hypothetical protein CINCED_3A006410 [Cinara cedri]
MASFFGWLFGIDQAQQGITQNASKIESLSRNVATGFAKQTNELAGQFTGLSKDVVTQVASISDTTAKVAEQTAGLAGKTNELAEKFAGVTGEVAKLSEQTAEKFAGVTGEVAKLSEQSAETAEQLANVTDALVSAEQTKMACVIVAGVMAAILVAFVICLVHQGIKAEKEKKSSHVSTDTVESASVNQPKILEEDLISLSDTESDIGNVTDPHLSLHTPSILVAA